MIKVEKRLLGDMRENCPKFKPKLDVRQFLSGDTLVEVYW